jgi:PEGA domain/Tetratricopeptide repeat
MRHSVVWLSALAFLTAGRPLLAAGPAASTATSNVDAARLHFQRGADFYKDGNFDAALAEFAKAQQLAPNFRILYNIGQVQAERHDYVAAVRTLTDYLAQGGAEIPEERRSQVQTEIASLRTKISELNVKSNVAGAEVAVDGVSMGLLPLATPLLVSAGSRRITVSKRGFATVERTIIVTGDDQAQLDVPLEALSAPSQNRKKTSGSDQASADGSTNVPAWVSVAATGVFASGAAVFGVMARSKNGDLDDALNGYPLNGGAVEDLRSDVKRNALLCDGFAAASAVSAIFAVYFFVSGSGHTEQRATVRSRLVASPQGVTLMGQF